MKPHTVITLYNRLTARLCGKRGTYPIPHSRNMLEAAHRFSAWCSEREISPKHFILARHDAIKWSRRIPIRDLIKVTERFLAHYDGWMAGQQGQRDQERDDQQRVQADTSSLTELTVLGESAKATFAQTPEVCLGSAATFTGGWHPDSRWCQTCPLSRDCRELLPEAVKRREQHAGCR